MDIILIFVVFISIALPVHLFLMGLLTGSVGPIFDAAQSHLRKMLKNGKQRVSNAGQHLFVKLYHRPTP